MRRVVHAALDICLCSNYCRRKGRRSVVLQVTVGSSRKHTRVVHSVTHQEFTKHQQCKQDEIKPWKALINEMQAWVRRWFNQRSVSGPECTT